MKEKSIFIQLIRIKNIHPKPLILAYFIWSGAIIILLSFKFPLWFWIIASYTQTFILIWLGCSIIIHTELPTINKPITGTFAKVVGVLIIFSGLYTLIGYKLVHFIFGIK